MTDNTDEKQINALSIEAAGIAGYSLRSWINPGSFETLPEQQKLIYARTMIREFLPYSDYSEDIAHYQTAEAAHQAQSESQQAVKRPDGSACEKCCAIELIIHVNRTAAVMIKKADYTDEDYHPPKVDNIVSPSDGSDSAMLKKMEWWGIEGYMTVEVRGYDSLREKDEAKRRQKDEVVALAKAFGSETYETKGPPTWTWSRGICRSILEGRYEIVAVHGDKHSTYHYDINGRSRKRRGLGLFGNVLRPDDYLDRGKGIDIHVGGNAIFTVGCILLAPDLQYAPLSDEKRKELLARYSKETTPPLIKGKFRSDEFFGTMPYWSQRESLRKVSELIEIMEKFRVAFLKNAPENGRLSHKTQEGKENPYRLDCIQVWVKDPDLREFKKVHVLDIITGPLSDTQIEMVKIKSDDTYEVTIPKDEVPKSETYTVKVPYAPGTSLAEQKAAMKRKKRK